MSDNGNKVYYWAPSVEWRKMEGNRLKVGKYTFTGRFIQSFPEFYYLATEGIGVRDLVKQFEDYGQEAIEKFVDHLIQNDILVSEVQDVHHLFEPQKRLFYGNHSWDEELLKSNESLMRFMEASRRRVPEGLDGAGSITLMKNNGLMDEAIAGRNSVREFAQEVQVSFEDFSALLEVLSLRNNNKRFFPSAGGLYPIDCYIDIKENRVEGMSGGVYYYHPYTHGLLPVSSSCDGSKEAHYDGNKQVYEASAFSMFFLYNASVSMPKYGGRAYFYAMIDAGILIQTLTLQGEKLGIGNCIIGIMDFNSIVKQLHLSRDQVYLFSAEFGLKIKS